ncbi:MAG: NACHT domain-containing protein, partial [Bacteroidota bacterium]
LYNEVEGYNSPFATLLLEEVYISTKLNSDMIYAPTRKLLSLHRGSGLSQQQRRSTQHYTFEIWTFLKRAKKELRYRQLVVLALGGYGKTTLLRYITLIYAKRLHYTKGVPRLIPFLIYLRQWRKILAEENAPDLPQFLCNHFIPDFGLREKPLLAWIEGLLRKGKALILLDGFDEMPQEARKTVSKWFGRQLQAYPESVFLLTSRPGGYRDYEAAEYPKTKLYVEPFSPDKVKEFISKWYFCQERSYRDKSDTNMDAIKAIVEERTTDLLEEIKQREELENMAKNPLLLNMIATHHRFYHGSELPRRRSELYQEIITMQLKDRPRAKRIQMLLPENESQSILQELSLAMLMQNQTTISHENLLILLKNSLKEETVEPIKFLEQIVKISELIIEQDTGEYEFAH